MMIRSAPPASAHFAESPVPAPAPMIGFPCSTCALRRASASARVTSPSSIISCSRSAMSPANSGSFTSSSSSCTSTSGPSVSCRPSSSAASASGSWKTWPSTAIIETPFSGMYSAVGPGRRRELAPDPPAELEALLGRRAHQRDRRVVDVEVPVREALGHGVPRAEVDHVERAERDDLRQPERARRLEPVGPGGEHAADELVGELGRRHVEDPGEEAALRERLHRLAAGAGRVEDEHLVAELLEPLARRRHARRRDAEHRGADQRAIRAEVAARGPAPRPRSSRPRWS